MANYYCEFCGYKTSSVNGLTAGHCMRHPDGINKGKHKLYEGGEKSKYTCKYCGFQSANLMGLTAGHCMRHPSGTNKGKHAPAL